ncbi:exopolysaccharide biosynthesis polyprenyl glycosylphosphotransferase [Flavobacterium hibisci]|uniref:exopolysaccharide biosynthesis polyprenyl glycosylphosphotransferase n=1 Tax=Flavobacterium hibisci TaxID=1914462 RepID=UPI001CBC1796|nr:exopolysaccharide biosynthesis polyprenyl glycosylphosphotransferase [Flavobacterium hibisci]MBZ4043597.1 exopolysaccharide biosynthesis polyprenyl glycosylphosphotransferase [Flavobacterium hibisci]
MRTKTGKYSGYIRPFSYLIDLLIVNFFAVYIAHFPVDQILFLAVLNIGWIGIASDLGFYEVYRYTKVIAILNCALKQACLFGFVVFALAFFYAKQISFRTLLFYLWFIFILILFIKFSIYYFLQTYRVVFGGNHRRVVLLGNKESISPLRHFFTENPDYGYELIHVFEFEKVKTEHIEQMFEFVLNKNMDEMYCSIIGLTQDQINEIIDFADSNLKTLKFIPDDNQIFFRNFILEYYDYIPVIALRSIKLDEHLYKIMKRTFDVVFSIVIIIGVLSWVLPILGILIKLESKGPVLLRQKRNGLNNKEFDCYKFRSMKMGNNEYSNQVSKNDPRVTKIGRFIRKTSIDELPQFFNVLIGEMSVVGPRPHIVSYNKEYILKVDKFMVRHFIKPGITGLAQVKGFRGEIETDNDIINRVKYDIFYIENWSILLDLKIIVTTIYHIIKGDKKAY